MNDAVRYLLPAIPTLLYGRLGRHQVDRLAVLRKACERTWERACAGPHRGRGLRHLVSGRADAVRHTADDFSPQRVQDELVGQMAELLEADYDTLALEINDSESRQRALGSEPAAPTPPAAPVVPAAPPRRSPPSAATRLVWPRDTTVSASGASSDTACIARSAGGTARAARRAPAGHIVTPAPTTERLQSIQRMVADQLGEALPDFEADALRAIPVQAGGLYPISDVWYIEAGAGRAGSPARNIAQFAREIAGKRRSPTTSRPASAASASSAWRRPWARRRRCRRSRGRC